VPETEVSPPEAGVAATNDYNQRESDNLMNIVAVVYGVALTTALSRHPNLLLRPLSAQNTVASVALLAAGLLTALSFFSYVLAIGGDTPYRIAWTSGSSGALSAIRFLVDLVLAGLYVRLLFAATDVAGRAPRLAGFVFAFIPVFAWAIVARLARSHKINWTAVVAALVALVLWFAFRNHTVTHDFDLLLVVVMLAGVAIYGAINHSLSYLAWKHVKLRDVISRERRRRVEN
jgi:hypothetical protein